MKEFVKTVMEAEFIIELKMKKLEYLKIHYKRLMIKIDENIVFLQNWQKKKNPQREGDNFFIVDLIEGENFEKLQDNHILEKSLAYLMLKYSEIFNESLPQRALTPIWCEKFRM